MLDARLSVDCPIHNLVFNREENGITVYHCLVCNSEFQQFTDTQP